MQSSQIPVCQRVTGWGFIHLQVICSVRMQWVQVLACDSREVRGTFSGPHAGGHQQGAILWRAH